MLAKLLKDFVKGEEIKVFTMAEMRELLILASLLSSKYLCQEQQSLKRRDKRESMAWFVRMWGFVLVILSVLIVFPSQQSWSPAEAIRSSHFDFHREDFQVGKSSSLTFSFKEAPAFRNGKECGLINRTTRETACDPAYVHIAITLDAEYLRGSMAAVLSVLQHASCPDNIFFHFLVTEMELELQTLVRTTFPYLRFKFYYFNADLVKGLISSSVRQALEQPLNYARNYLANMLEPCVRRVIYLDSDLVVVDDVAKLWNISLGETRTVGAPEYCHANFTKYFSKATFWSDEQLSKSFQGRNPCYFNTGVMVIDLAKWRLNNFTKMIEHWMEVQKEKRIYDLGSLPPFLLVFTGNVEPVDHRWNQHGLGGDNVNGSCWNLHSGPVSLLHWSGKGKPWLRLDAKEPCPLDTLWAPDYALVWSSMSGKGKKEGNGFFWEPIAPQGYKALGYLVTNVSDKPSLEEVRCVRSDLTGVCKTDRSIWNGKKDGSSIQMWSIMPDPEKKANGVFEGTFYCTTSSKNESSELPVACLLNANSPMTGMPSLEEVHSIIGKYGPSVFCHPKEIYLPSSVPWFLKNGALLYKKGSSTPEAIAEDGSNLPQGGSADGEYWIDLPTDSSKAKMVRRGDLDSAEAYIHVKSVLGGTFTDVVMWVFYPFNGPGNLLLLGALSIPLGKIGEHVGDWEHVTLRINNFTGELWGVYLSQHSGGRWVKAGDLEYIEGSKKAVVYSSKNGHANFSRAGVVIQGSQKLGVGIANYSKKSAQFLDTSIKYKIVAAGYLKGIEGSETVTEPAWLNYGRKWGPKIKYATSGLLGSIKLPSEISGQDGPTGPKWKSDWYGDEKVKDIF